MQAILSKILLCAILTGCATKADKISPTYVSPLLYQNYDCQQLAAEAQRVSARAAAVSGEQNKQAKKDAVATGVGIVVFWPALLFLAGGNDNEAEVASLKGQMQAIEHANIQKKCGLQFQTGCRIGLCWNSA